MEFLLQPRIVVHLISDFLKKTYPNAYSGHATIARKRNVWYIALGVDYTLFETQEHKKWCNKYLNKEALLLFSFDYLQGPLDEDGEPKPGHAFRLEDRPGCWVGFDNDEDLLIWVMKWA